MIKDLIRPLQHHTCGIPPQIRTGMRHMSGNQKLIDMSAELYEFQLRRIEQALSGNAPVGHEQECADLAAHLIIDAAYVNMCLREAGYAAGAFPYDDLADKLFPKKIDGDTDSNGSGV